MFLGFPLLALLGVASLVVRYRRAGSDTRQQMKWLLLTVGAPLVAFLFLSLAEEIFGLNPSNVIWGTLYLMIPVGLGISLLRYKLFDVDTVIRKTAQYVIVTALLALIYFGLIVALQQLITPFTGDSDVVVVLSTLLIAALFLPLRRRVQNAIDHRFYRRKYDAEKVLAQFAATVRDETDLDALTAELLRVIQETMEPEHISIWLRNPEEMKDNNPFSRV
jgi:peptidoglycan/LPS O-acetylase OafA/YrhL